MRQSGRKHDRESFMNVSLLKRGKPQSALACPRAASDRAEVLPVGRGRLSSNRFRPMNVAVSSQEERWEPCGAGPAGLAGVIGGIAGVVVVFTRCRQPDMASGDPGACTETCSAQVDYERRDLAVIN
jgi:hypothetical protein